MVPLRGLDWVKHMGTSLSNAPSAAPDTEFLRLPAVIRRTGLSRSTVYRLISKQKFPDPVQLTSRSVGWRCVDLDRWSASRKTGVR